MSRGDHIKLVGEQEQPQQPTFPHTNVQFGPNGVAVTIRFADDIMFTKIFNETDMNEICRQWIETRKQVKQQLEMIQNIEKSKL